MASWRRSNALVKTCCAASSLSNLGVTSSSCLYFSRRSFYDRLKERYQNSTVEGFEPGPAAPAQFTRQDDTNKETTAAGEKGNTGTAQSNAGHQVDDILLDKDASSLAALDKSTKVTAEQIGNAFLPVFVGLAVFLFSYWYVDVWGDGRSSIASRNRADWKLFMDFSEPEEAAAVPPGGIMKRTALSRSY